MGFGAERSWDVDVELLFLETSRLAEMSESIFILFLNEI